MINNELISLMQILSTSLSPTLRDIEASTHATKRQTLYRFEKLNQILKEEHAPVFSYSTSPSRKINIPEESKMVFKRLLLQANAQDAYYFSREERLFYIYFLLFINEEYISLNHFTDALKCSRSTVLSDFKELKLLLQEENIQICNNRQRGYYLVGSEINIRRFLIQCITKTLSSKQSSKILDMFTADWRLNIFDFSRQVITELAVHHGIRLIEARLLEFIYIFILLMARIKSGIQADLSLPSYIETDVIPTLKEYAFTADLLAKYPDISGITDSDIKYITSWIIGISYGSINEDTKDRPFISSIVKNILIRFESLSGVQLDNADKMFVQLYAHLRPAYYRLIFHLPIINPLCETVKSEYWDLYQLVNETMKPFAVIFNSEIPDDEITYLTMHFAAAFAKRKIQIEPQRKKALVICPNGIGSSSILYSELIGLFPELKFLPPSDTSILSDTSLEADIIFTSSHAPLHTTLSIPVIHLNPVMSSNEKSSIRRRVYKWLHNGLQNQPDIDAIMEIISKHAEIHERNALQDELLTYFSKDEFTDIPSEIKLHLTDMVCPEIITLNLEAAGKEEAIRKTYEPMVKLHQVLPDYVDEVVRTANPYMVITKHVALPHAKPDAGAITYALGIGVLKEPIVFAKNENDPVKYIFALSAINNSSHLSAMAELTNLLNDGNFFHILDTASSPDEIMEYIRSHI